MSAYERAGMACHTAFSTSGFVSQSSGNQTCNHDFQKPCHHQFRIRGPDGVLWHHNLQKCFTCQFQQTPQTRLPTKESLRGSKFQCFPARLTPGRRSALTGLLRRSSCAEACTREAMDTRSKKNKGRVVMLKCEKIVCWMKMPNFSQAALFGRMFSSAAVFGCVWPRQASA